ncbi:ribokinase [Hoeflea marina]|uniref:Ribokinase n=1 Tax=Hoeflea marina TaxID=274592 RepID=A0A317PI42_9HYPH|nr:ribokinase [Hoeflea marina]PWW00014.1 ribokinase [Hoeflea marina]
MSVFVCGSLHLDIIIDAPHLPRLDETVTGEAVRYAFGGKGGNQAVAAARMGAMVQMAGRVGSDEFGTTLLAGLAEAGVDASAVSRDPGASGMSVAISAPDGGYGAVIVSAANLRIDPAVLSLPPHTTVVLLQNEIPEAVNLAVARKARASGSSVVLNAAPARGIGAELMDCVDVLVVNRVEAADMLDLPEPDLDAESAARALAASGPASVIVTLGGQGLVVSDSEGTHRFAAHAVGVISTHGAGDAFLGAFAAERDRGASLSAAAAFGQAAAALHVSTPVAERGRISQACVDALLDHGSRR